MSPRKRASTRRKASTSTIKPGGPDIAPEQVIAGGGADVIVDWMGGALAAREKGVPLVNIAQPFKKAGMELVCPKDGPVKTEADFKGKTLGVWFFGNEYPFYAWMNKLGLKTEGGAGRRHRAEAELRRAAADPEAGRLHLGHDLQRVLAAHRRRLQAGRPDRLQLLGDGQRPARGRPLRAGGQAQGSGLRGQDGALRARLDEGLEIRDRQPGRSGRHRRGRPAARTRTTRSA